MLVRAVAQFVEIRAAWQVPFLGLFANRWRPDGSSYFVALDRLDGAFHQSFAAK
jgi:hypothetical protein